VNAESTVDSRRSDRRHFLRAFGTCLALTVAHPVRAADYPSRTVTVIVPYAPGGQGDVFARLIGDRLARALGQAVVVDNRPGASGALGARLVASAPPDGHMLLLGQTGEIAINGAAMKKPGYDALRDFRPVALVGDAPLVLATPSSSPFANLDDLLQSARAKPGSVAYASSGVATPGHLAAAALASETKVEMTHVPYKGAGQAIIDLVGGQVQCFFASASSIMPHLQGGKVRALAVSSPTRIPALPEVPPVADTLPGFSFSLWGGYFAPRATPDDVVQRLASEINRILAEPEIRQRFEAEGSAVAPGTSQDVERFVRDEIAKYTRLVKVTGATLE